MTMTQITPPALRPQNLYYETKFATIGVLERLQSDLARVADSQAALAEASREQIAHTDRMCEQMASLTAQQKRACDLQAAQHRASTAPAWAAMMTACNEEGAIVGTSALAAFLREVIGRDSVRWCVTGQVPKREVIDAPTFAARATEIAPKYGLDQHFQESDYLTLHAAINHAHPVLREVVQRPKGHDA